MIYALFLTCVVGTSDDLTCAVSYTDMTKLATNQQHCLAKGDAMQRHNMASALYNDPSLKPGMQEVYCGTREQMIVKAADEYNKFRKYGVYTEFFEF